MAVKPKAADSIDDSSAPLIEHLAELRTRLIWSVTAFLIGIMLAFVVAEPTLDFMLRPIERVMRDLGDPNPVMQYTAPQEYFFTLVQVSVVLGLMMSFPVIAYQLWRFVAPGLYRSEKNAFLPFLVASPVLFLIGGAFAYLVVTPMAMRFFLGFADVSSVFTAMLPMLSDAPATAGGAVSEGVTIVFHGKVNETLDILLKLIIAFGLCFQLPVLLVLMGKAGLVSAAGLRAGRKWALVLILMVAAIATPPDVLSQIILFLAVYPLYEISILLITRIERKRNDELAAEGLLDPEDQ